MNILSQSSNLAQIQGCEMLHNHSTGELWSLLKQKAPAHRNQKQVPVIIVIISQY